MRHIWQNEVRQKRHEAVSIEQDDRVTAPVPETPETLFSRKLLRSEIVHAIDALPEAFREVIVLREIEGFSYAEIARLLDCPPGTVMSRLARARQFLRRLLIKFAPSSKKEVRQ